MSTQLKAGLQALRGWEQTIEQLNTAADVGEFMRGMLDLQCKIVAAEYGSLWTRDAQGELVQKLSWPAAFAQANPPAALTDVLKRAAEKGFSESRSCVLEAKPDGGEGQVGGGDPSTAHVFVTVLKGQDQQVRGLTTVVAASRDKTILQQTAPLRELAAGLYTGFESKQTAKNALQIEQRIRQSVALLATCQSAEGFKGSAMNLVNELARHLKCARVSLGWIRGHAVKLVAMSDTEHLKRHSEQVSLIELAMGECLDQQQPIMYPVTDGSEPLLAQAVVHAHRRVSAANGQRQIVSIPLRSGDEWIGVVTLEGPDEAFEEGEMQRMQLVADVVAPHLVDRREADRSVPGFAWQWTRKNVGKLVGPKHVVWKMLAIAIFAVLAYVAFGSWNYRVSADFVLDAKEKRILPAPFEGNLAAVYVEEGDTVAAGDVLAELNVFELKLQRSESVSRLRVLELDKSEAKANREEARAKQAEAGMEQVRARLALLDYQINKAKIIAPIAGKVLAGSWNDRVGSVIEQGEAMFEVGPLDAITAIVRVPEDDIDQVALGNHGQIATRTAPDRKFDINVDRIVPLASPVDTKNVFEVRCLIAEPAVWMRPGMEGTARLDAGRRPVYWILTHQLADLLRLWLWW